MIGTLPFLDKILSKRVSYKVKVLVGLVLLYSLWIQITAVSLDWGAYNAALPPEANGLGEWGGGLNTLQYLRWVLIPSLWNRYPVDFAWIRNDLPLWLLACVVIAGLSGFTLWRTIRSEKFETGYKLWLLPIGLSGALLLTIHLGLQAIYHDKLYRGNEQSLFDISKIVQQETQSGDLLLLSNNNYSPFFLNYGYFTWPRVITLPDQPGENVTLNQPPRPVSSNSDTLLDKFTIPFLTRLAQMKTHLWLLTDTGPWITGSVRSVERYLTVHYYPIRELSSNPPDPTVRLLEYSTIAAPDPFAFRAPGNTTDFLYGDTVHLAGFYLPSGTIYEAGDTLPLTLYWEADSQPQADYTVAWFVVDEEGNTLVQGEDAQPVGGFAPTTSWRPGIPIWDNRALQIPDDAVPGTYHLWVRLYSFDSSNIPAILPVMGSETRDGITGVLPVELHISSGSQ